MRLDTFFYSIQRALRIWAIIRLDMRNSLSLFFFSLSFPFYTLTI